MLNKFINRRNELAVLEKQYAVEQAGLVILYGRRRLGKTALLREFADSKPHCYFMADRAAEPDLRASMAIAMSEALSEPSIKAARYGSWYDLFAVFDRLRNKGRKHVLILDEFQYLCQVQPAFSSLIQKWWDEHWKDDNILLVLCGSVTSMMYRETLASSAPLYGRSTAQLLLRPIQFQHIPEFLPAVDHNQLVPFYALTGGVPRYLELARPFKSFKEALCQLVLDPDGILHNEAKQLLQNEIQTPNIYWSLLHTIGGGANRISEIAARMQEPASKLTRYLDLLKDLSLVTRETPVLEKNPAKSKKGIYTVNDPFCRLWFGVVYPYSSFFEFGETAKIYPKIEAGLNTHIANCYEETCRSWVKTHGIDFDAVKVGRQWSKHYEIDVAAVNTSNELTVIGESKWSTREVGVPVLNSLNQKLSEYNLPLAEKCTTILFGSSGFTSELKQIAERNPNLRLVESVF